jgi:hypothetical protein
MLPAVIADVRQLPPVLQRMLELWNGGDVDPAEVYARGCTVDGGAGVFDPEDVMPEIWKYRAAFPDLRWSVERCFATGGRYVLRMQATGTHTGAAFPTEIGTVEATGRPFTLQGLEVFELHDDRIVDSWQTWDTGPLYASLP